MNISKNILSMIECTVPPTHKMKRDFVLVNIIIHVKFVQKKKPNKITFFHDLYKY